MGLGDRQQVTYLSVSGGKVCQRVPAGTPNATPRTDNEGKPVLDKNQTQVFELKHGYVEGFIVDITVREGEYNGQKTRDWQFHIHDGQEKYILGISMDNRNAMSMVNALLNPACDFNKPFTLTPWRKVVNDKTKTAIFMSQQGTDIKWHCTKETPNGLPEATMVNFKGKDQWDFFPQVKFFEEQIMKVVLPKVKASEPVSIMGGSAPATQTNSPAPAGYPPSELPGPDDDLPF